MSKYFFFTATLLGLLALFIPTAWYTALPLSQAVRDFPISGILLLKTSLYLDAAFLLAIAVGYKKIMILGTEAQTPTLEKNNFHDKKQQFIIIFIVGVAAILRFYRLDTDLWLDEVVTVNFSKHTLGELLSLYEGTNHHLLNTLLVKLSMIIFGDSEWAIRLPTAILGILTVPALFFLVRRAMGFWHAIAVAAILTVSYQHIYFSQNARGYISHIFFSLISTLYLLKSLKTNNRKHWLLFAMFSFLNMASLINSVFVVFSHGLICIISIWKKKNKLPTLINSTLSFSAVALLTFNLYATIIPQLLVLVKQVYSQKSTGFDFFSFEFLTEIINGLLAGFGAIVWLGLAILLVFVIAKACNITYSLLIITFTFITSVYNHKRPYYITPIFSIWYGNSLCKFN